MTDRMCLLVRVRREKDEGRGEKRGGGVRTKEERKWDEGPSGMVKGNGLVLEEIMTSWCSQGSTFGEGGRRFLLESRRPYP